MKCARTMCPNWEPNTCVPLYDGVKCADFISADGVSDRTASAGSVCENCGSDRTQPVPDSDVMFCRVCYCHYTPNRGIHGK